MIEIYKLTFRELKTQPDKQFSDPYNIASSLNSSMKKAILNNPSGYDDEEVCQILALDNNIVVGVTNPFSGRAYINQRIVPIQSGSYLFAHEDYRKENVGGDLFWEILNLHPSKNCYFSGISRMAMGLYKAMKVTIFEFPRLIYLRRSRSVINYYLRTESVLLYPLVWLTDACLRLHRSILRIIISGTVKDYEVVESKTVPKEIDDIILNDPHPYAEYHGRDWIEWNLNYSLTDEPRVKRLFIVKRNNKIEAFFIIKQQFFKEASVGFKNLYLGSVMEWGISKNSSLSEKDLNLMTIHYFDDCVDAIQIATTDEILVKTLRKYLFIHVGEANVGIRMRSIKEHSITEMKKWRIRLAGCDTLIN